ITINNNFMGNHDTAHIFWVGGRIRCSSSTPNFFGNNVTDGVGPDRSNAFACDTLSPSTLQHQAGSSLFVNYKLDGSGDYHLQTSQLLGTPICTTGGISPCTPTNDFDGLLRNTPSLIGVYLAPQGSALPSPPSGLIAFVQ